MKKTRVLIDMDEVLTDFVGAVCSAWDVSAESVLQNWAIGQWAMAPPLSKALGYSTTMEDSTFWERLNGNEVFWESMAPLPWVREVVAFVESMTDDWHIVSAPSWCTYSYSGKVKWLKRYFGREFTRFALTPHKEIFAGQHVLLIDDRESNVEKFRAAGGQAVLFPRHHNSKHEHRLDPVGYLERLLED